VTTKGHVGFSLVKLGRKNISDREKSLANPHSGLIEGLSVALGRLTSGKESQKFLERPGGPDLVTFDKAY